jgi:hypothetical protein
MDDAVPCHLRVTHSSGLTSPDLVAAPRTPPRHTNPGAPARNHGTSRKNSKRQNSHAPSAAGNTKLHQKPNPISVG